MADPGFGVFHPVFHDRRLDQGPEEDEVQGLFPAQDTESDPGVGSALDPVENIVERLPFGRFAVDGDDEIVGADAGFERWRGRHGVFDLDIRSWSPSVATRSGPGSW